MENQVARQQFGLAFRSQESLAALRQTAMMFSLSSFVKANELKGGTEFAVNNSMILCQMAQDFNVPVYSLLNSVYFIHGTPSFTSQFFISRFNMTGKFSRISYELSGKGDDFGCVASCIELATKQTLAGARVSLKMARDSNWSPIWWKLPEQMLRYRSAVFLIRSVAPEVMLGFYSVDEQKDIAHAEGYAEDIQVQPQPQPAPQQKSIELVIEPKPEPEKKPESIQTQFEQLCIFGAYDCEAILAFTLEAYRKKGVSKSPEECMELFVNKPELLERAQQRINEQKKSQQSQPQAQAQQSSPMPVANTEEAPKSSEDKGASTKKPAVVSTSPAKEEKSVAKEKASKPAPKSQALPLPTKVEEFQSYLEAGHKLVIWMDKIPDDPYGIEDRIYADCSNGGLTALLYEKEWNNHQQVWKQADCFKRYDEIVAYVQNRIWKVLPEGTPEPNA